MAGTSAGAKKGWAMRKSGRRGSVKKAPAALNKQISFYQKAPKITTPSPKSVTMSLHKVRSTMTPAAVSEAQAHNKARAKLMGQYNKQAKAHVAQSNARYEYMKGAPFKTGRY